MTFANSRTLWGKIIFIIAGLEFGDSRDPTVRAAVVVIWGTGGLSDCVAAFEETAEIPLQYTVCKLGLKTTTREEIWPEKDLFEGCIRRYSHGRCSPVLSSRSPDCLGSVSLPLKNSIYLPKIVRNDHSRSV